MSSEALMAAPCPFCTCNTLSIESDPASDEDYKYYVQCNEECWAAGPRAASPEDAVRYWNASGGAELAREFIEDLTERLMPKHEPIAARESCDHSGRHDTYVDGVKRCRKCQLVMRPENG